MANKKATPAPEPEEEYVSTPWHFKLLVLAFVLYMLFRGVQLIGWLIERI